VLDGKFLSIYLNDHLAGSTISVELARRTLSSNRGTEYGEFLEWLVRQIQDDRQSLITLMERVAVADLAARLEAIWLIELQARADEQLRRLDEHRNAAARDALANVRR
jgi:hypothetical protein